jgi:hypothetical protein
MKTYHPIHNDCAIRAWPFWMEFFGHRGARRYPIPNDIRLHGMGVWVQQINLSGIISPQTLETGKSILLKFGN